MTDEELKAIAEDVDHARSGRVGPAVELVVGMHAPALLAEVKWLREVVKTGLTPHIQTAVDAAMSHLTKIVKPLEWTRELPTVDGEYYMRLTAGHPVPVLVAGHAVNSAVPQVYYFGVSSSDRLDRLLGAEWAGPLEAPR